MKLSPFFREGASLQHSTSLFWPQKTMVSTTMFEFKGVILIPMANVKDQISTREWFKELFAYLLSLHLQTLDKKFSYRVSSQFF